MNCRTIEQDLALAAIDALESPQLDEVRRHCKECAPCARRLAEWQQLGAEHARVAAEIRDLPLPFVPNLCPRPAQLSDSGRRSVGAWRWRWALPLGALAGLAITLAIYRQAVLEAPPMAPDVVAVHRPARRDSIPSLAAYRSALKESGADSLDALLARQERHLLPGSPDVTLRLALKE